jgi:hypothetical protein
MRHVSHSLAAAGLVLLLAGLFSLNAARAPKRQYYDKSWEYQKDKKYYTKTYYYRPTKGYTGKPKHQYIVYKPSRSKNWVYWYNPEKKKYWARCPTRNHPVYGAKVKDGKDYWSMLPNEKKKGNLDDIDDEDWGKAQNNSPPIPGNDDDETIQCPPSDLPRG